MNPHQPAGRTRTRILVVDDDPSIRVGLSEILVSEGYQVNTASSAERICHLVEAVTPDLILMDLVLPGVNGFEAVTDLKNNGGTADIPVVAMTASWLGSQCERLATVGFDSALRKPFSGSVLCREIQRVRSSHEDGHASEWDGAPESSSRPRTNRGVKTSDRRR